MVSERLNLVREFLLARQVPVVGSPIWSPSGGTVIVTVARDDVGPRAEAGKTSKRQLVAIRRTLLRRHGISVDFVIAPSSRLPEIETELRGVVSAALVDIVPDVLVTEALPGVMNVWVVSARPEGDLTPAARERARDSTSRYLKAHDLLLGEFGFLTTARGSARPVDILKAVKVSQPASDAAIKAQLLEDRISYGSDKALRGQLDILRKRGLIARLRTGSYVITARGLSVVPRRRGGESSDVKRALALGKRRW